MSTQAIGLGVAERTSPGVVLEEVKRLAVEQLGGVPSGLYAPIEEALHDSARRAGIAGGRRADHAALLALRQRNAANVMRFRQIIAQGFDDFRGMPAGMRSRNGIPLGLVDENQLDYHFAGQKLAESIGQRFARQIEMIEARLETLAAALGQPPASNPIGAHRLAGAFIATFRDAEIPESLRPLLFRQYELELARVLGDLYARVNTLLAASGYGKSNPALRAPAAEGGAPAANADEELIARQRLSELRGMLHEWRAAQGPAATHAADGTPRRELRRAEVGSVASLLQGDSPEPFARALAGAGSLADAIRAQLAEAGRRLGLDPATTRMAEEDQDAIDMVGLLFESLFQTHAILDRARRMYARLVLPYVRVALSDETLFVQRDHPARRLLDLMTEACEGNDGTSPHDRELLERAAGAAQRIVADYNEDLEVFRLVSSELEALMEQQRRRVDVLEKRASEAVHGKERLMQARLQAGAALAERLGKASLTQAVADFLVRHWQHHLQQTLLRDGHGSARHADVLALADALVVVDGLAAEQRGGQVADRLIALQPAITECLASCGLDGDAARDWLAGLVRAFAQPDLPRTRHEAPVQVAEDEAEPVALQVVGGHDGLRFDPLMAERMRRLLPGEWLRLRDERGEYTGAKVAWLSPLSGRLLLVNRRGVRMLVASPEQLAAMAAEDRVVVGSEPAPFDEALRQMRQRLGKVVGAN